MIQLLNNTMLTNILLMVLGTCVVLATPPSRSLPRVGIFYSGWHVPAYYAQDHVIKQGQKAYCMEDLIRGTDGITFHDIYENRQVPVPGHDLMYWHVAPSSGYYCIYRKRPSESSGHWPDCPNITQTLERHAQELTAAGIDFILYDATNIDIYNAQSDYFNYRPFEVLAEEWKSLRDRGITTPDIAIWFPIPNGANAFRVAIENVYQNPAFDDLILKHQTSGKKVVHIVASSSNSPDPAIVDQLENEFNLVVVHNWAMLGLDKYEQDGYWSMMSPCISPNRQYTTSVVGRDCNPVVTQNSPLGTMVSVSKSFQMSYASMPFTASGVLNGLTFKKQMQEAIRIKPDYLFVTAWNEHTAQPQNNPFRSSINAFWSPGLQSAYTHASSYTGNHLYPLWVDLYGEEYSRDFEPTVHSGDKYYNLLKSCIKVFRSGGAICDNQNEECCRLTESDIYTNIWSLSQPSDQDHLLTKNQNERNILLQSGWKDECIYFDLGDGVFCRDTSISDVTKGPFILFSSTGPNRIPLYRCLKNDNGYHFFSVDSECEGHKTESTLGYLSTVKTSETPRTLTRCYYSTRDQHVHSLDNSCPPESNQEGTYGYVR